MKLFRIYKWNHDVLHTSALIVEFMTSQHFSIKPSNWSNAAAASTDTTVFGSSVTSSKYSDPNTIFNANFKIKKINRIIYKIRLH